MWTSAPCLNTTYWNKAIANTARGSASSSLRRSSRRRPSTGSASLPSRDREPGERYFDPELARSEHQRERDLHARRAPAALREQFVQLPELRERKQVRADARPSTARPRTPRTWPCDVGLRASSNAGARTHCRRSRPACTRRRRAPANPHKCRKSSPRVTARRRASDSFCGSARSPKCRAACRRSPAPPRR